MSRLSYQQSGVDYQSLDAFKRLCQRHAVATVTALSDHGYAEPPGIRGESAYLIEAADHYLAHVEEGLGTKNLVADAMHALTGRNYYHNIGIDTVATIVNDLITTGAAPLSVAIHAAVGDTAWFNDRQRAEDLAAGFAQGCKEAGAVWGGGETPVLKDVIEKNAIVLAGSAIGIIDPKINRVVGDIRDGDAIILLASSGVHTNGLTLCRAVAERLPKRFLTPLADGRSFGEALLDPSNIYARFVQACKRAGIRLHYAVHITGHGWRKLMRLQEPFVYRIEDVGTRLEVFNFLQQAGSIDIQEMYATFNMGAGFAAYVDASDARTCIELAQQNGYSAWRGGEVRKNGSRKAVEIPPLGIIFQADSLQVR